MLSKIILFYLLAAVTCQNGGDLDSIMSQNFEPQNLSCNTTAGQAGVCVPYYLCNNNNTLNTDGSWIVELRIQNGPCLSRYDVCCLASNKLDTPVTPKPELKRDGCGWRNPKGVGMRTTGDVDGETKFGEIPWMCAILIIHGIKNDPDSQKRIVYGGGGSLIHPSVVLTSVHQVAPLMRVRAGEWDTKSIKEPYPYQDRDVASVDIHHDFIKG